MNTENTTLCFTTGSTFSLIGVHMFNIAPLGGEVLHAFVIGMVGGAGGLVIKYIFNFFRSKK